MASAVLTAVCHDFKEFFLGSCCRFILLGFLFCFFFVYYRSINRFCLRLQSYRFFCIFTILYLPDIGTFLFFLT